MSDRRILKYSLFHVRDQAFNDQVKILALPSLWIQHVALQDGVVTLWSLVDIEACPVVRTFLLAGTGHRLEPALGRTLGTVFDRAFVWHIFELF